MRIDIHTHFFPRKYLDELRKLNVSMDQTLDPKFMNLDPRLKDMDRCGIEKQILSISVPGVDLGTHNDSIRLARTVNDELARVVEKSQRFFALASLPMTSPGDAVDELDRAINTLGLKGAGIYSNVAGKSLDRPEFWPVYEKAARMQIPIFIHPAPPTHTEYFQDYDLVPVLGFPFETCVAATRLVLSGLIERCPDLMIVLAHLGGVLPFLIGRIDDGHRMLPVARKDLQRPPREYFKKFYLDTVSFHKPALSCAHQFWGAERLLLGSDYPYDWVDDYTRCVTSIESLEIDDDQKCEIMYNNAKRLLRIE